MEGTGADAKEIPKSRDTWSPEELDKSTRNSKALNAIYAAVSADEFHRISNCEAAKKA
ncbi:hypothetical protein BVC80_1481g68 [Macleaya cordata]|uniref:Uncharacterized protein n=1 Tax=Macleaya cordata TaxID=56857 RepID=A0A200QNI8_MACCD|nr:hypothetical protein BVC80_1481g68 [Macleaya cordata]